ncbi:efflux transporter, RND family, MFP subunit [Janthinobacterium agaricidamnosum NBRC 102515 = DSM 9628]|uniref:Efflux transporter, RND family, MFP subunit n=1 Tax=Janthinobacterium agaricidamnosum NBRC 102515 = DSM 9628 TaxID=1349767 RepID=W0V9N2_9BURK|nr:efflux transporter, RND family, MFP subunit [Janthinobacterium agaricidamnosum NBRC 102515 = DSM 9628]
MGAAVCIVAGAWYFTQKPGPEGGKGGAGAAQPATVVSTITPLRQDVPVVLQANGTVTPISSVDLHPQTTSTITKVHIREGQFIKAGDLMFTLDARSEHANVDKAKAQVLRDQAALADVERQYKRSMELLSKNFIAQGAVDTLKSQRDSARALLVADTAALRAVQVDASYTTIRAPMSGRVGAIPVYAGSLVQLATSLTTITQLDPITVAFTLPESRLSGLLAANKAGTVPVQALLPDAGGKEVRGALSFIDNTVDPQAGVIRVKAQFANQDTQLWPGQYVYTRLTVQTLKDALVIPQNAIINNTSGTFVYIVDSEHTARVRKVSTLYAFGGNAAVSGLQGGEQVIVDGKQNLRPGGKVRLADKVKEAPGDAARDAHANVAAKQGKPA